MNTAIFKHMISIHGVNPDRWDGIDPDDLKYFKDPENIKAFIKSSDKVAAFYERAEKLDRALDCYAVKKVPPSLRDKVMNEDPDSLQIPGKIVSPPAFIARKPVWAGLTALAAAIILFVAVTGQMAVQHMMPNGPIDGVTDSAADSAAEIDVFLAEILLPEEDIASFFDLAQAAPVSDESVEDFIDSLLEEEILEEEIFEK